MESLFMRSGALIIGVGSLVGALWLWSGIGNWCLEYWIFLRKAALIDGPPALPIIGNALHFVGDTNELLNEMIALAKTYTSSLRVWLGPKLIVAISSPSDIEILIKCPSGAHKSSEYRFIEYATGSGLLTSSGPTHKLHRNLFMPMVNGKVLNEFIDSFEIQSQRCVKCLESHLDSGKFNVKPFVENWSIDIILDSIIGVEGTVQQGGHTELKEAIIELNNSIFERLRTVWLYPDWIYSCTKSGRKCNKGITFVRKFMDNIIAEKKQKYHDSRKSCNPTDPQRSAFLDQLIAYNEEHKLINDTRFREELTAMLIVAQDPPASIASFLLLMLAMHPEIQDKVRAEAQGVIGNESVTARNSAQLKYLDMVIKETIRLFPIGIMTFREAMDDVKFGSYTAPKGCTIAMFIFMTHRDPELWKEPNKFDPDRFSSENSVGRHPYAFIPFSNGLRGCIGKQFAMMMLKTLVTRILQKYRLHSDGSLENLRLANNLFVRSTDGYKISITRL